MRDFTRYTAAMFPYYLDPDLALWYEQERTEYAGSECAGTGSARRLQIRRDPGFQTPGLFLSNNFAHFESRSPRPALMGNLLSFRDNALVRQNT